MDSIKQSHAHSAEKQVGVGEHCSKKKKKDVLFHKEKEVM